MTTLGAPACLYKMAVTIIRRAMANATADLQSKSKTESGPTLSAREGQTMLTNALVDEKPIPQTGNAIDRWDNEGGAPSGPGPETMVEHIGSLGSMGRQVIKYLGAAVVIGWNDLPTDVQRTLFKMATTDAASHSGSELPARIARFLHNHKDDLAPQPATPASLAPISQ